MKDENEHTQQKLDALRLEHRDLDEVISRLANDVAVDEFQLQRMKKRKLFLKDHDVTIICGNERIQCHKLILCASSDVFKAMFTHEYSENRTGEVAINDADPAAVRALLSGMYGQPLDTEADADLLLSVLYLTEKYNVKTVKDQCQQLLMSYITIENCVSMLIHANFYNAEVLKDQAVKVASRCLEGLNQSPHYKFIERKCPELLECFAKAKSEIRRQEILRSSEEFRHRIAQRPMTYTVVQNIDHYSRSYTQTTHLIFPSHLN